MSEPTVFQRADYYNLLSSIRLNSLRYYSSLYAALPTTDRRNKRDLIYWILESIPQPILQRLLTIGAEAETIRQKLDEEFISLRDLLYGDARFLAGVALQKQMDQDRAYNERMKRVFRSLEGERAEAKAMEKQKTKEKRRAGRK
ncbi:hypothetical protein F5887DRAFT_1082414 [Amanita rubescens]|nr:hypothetical protein F5887DRAFT_1082414 [Amanita rubescens]